MADRRPARPGGGPMTAGTPDVLEALRLPELYRKVFLYAGIPLPPAAAPGECFVLRSGDQPPDLFAKLLEEAFLEDQTEVGACRPTDPPEAQGQRPGQIEVRPGFDSPCPAAEELRRAARSGAGPVLVFAVEH